MYNGVCLLSAVPCRKEPSSTSEMVTQLLFGDHYTVKEQTEKWIRIVTAYDNYECWINRQQHHKISEATFRLIDSENAVMNADLIGMITNKSTGVKFPVPMGAVLPGYANKECRVDDHVFTFEGKTTTPGIKKTYAEVIETARQFLNAPYLWGGKTFMGIDCSGFSQIVYKVNGYKLPRDAYQQAELGHPLSFVEEAQTGDLAFFDNEEGKIIHVGILLNNTEIMHAHGKVRIDKFDHYGIFHSENKKYSHMLRVIKRI